MLKLIKFVSDNVKYIKVIAVIISCFAAAATVFHDQWEQSFPENKSNA